MMLNRLNHIAIAVNNLDQGIKIYKDTLGVQVSKKLALPKHGVTTVFVNLSNTNIELLEPLGKDSPISNFLIKNPSGGVHHDHSPPRWCRAHRRIVEGSNNHHFPGQSPQAKHRL